MGLVQHREIFVLIDEAEREDHGLGRIVPVPVGDIRREHIPAFDRGAGADVFTVEEDRTRTEYQRGDIPVGHVPAAAQYLLHPQPFPVLFNCHFQSFHDFIILSAPEEGKSLPFFRRLCYDERKKQKGGILFENYRPLCTHPQRRLHLGNLYAALLCWLSVRPQGGEMLLRIEDLDTLRCTVESADLLKEDLQWLGLDWDREMPPQRSRSAYYEEILAKLSERGEVFPCWCTRGDLKNAANAPHASDGHPIYPGTCRALSPQERAIRLRKRPGIMRLAVPDEVIGFEDGNYGRYEENLQTECGAFILRRADGVFAYQLAVVADDIDGGVTEVVRGRDLLDSTPRQLYLYRLLGAEPPRYFHVPLLTAPDGRRLSKRDEDLDVGLLRQRYRPEELLGALAFAAGQLERPEPVSAAELVKIFDRSRVGQADIAIRLPGEEA
ncbi:MAG: tRNA glutamyl-Q(34) synthetase GluQRS [Clostridiales bacterium]|nr:tRNA glutamyl-Q(34) synthetase GluQRS [Candidatus Apopatocola equi]